MLVSTIIPTYNRKEYLERALKSVLNDCEQNDIGFNYEIIVVDDGSTDDTIEMLQRYAGPIKTIEQNHLGANHARNAGLEIASGEYIRFLDSDDWIFRGVTEKQLKIMQQCGADVCYGNWVDTIVTPNGTNYDKHRIVEEMKDPIDFLLADYWCAPFCYLHKKSVVQRVDGWSEEFEACQDFDFILKIALQGVKFTHSYEMIGTYFHHRSARISRNNRKKWCDAKKEILTRTFKVLQGHSRLTQSRRTALAESLLHLAKNYISIDKNSFRDCIRLIHKISPKYLPQGKIYPKLVKIFGYEYTESILELRRGLRRKVYGRV